MTRMYNRHFIRIVFVTSIVFAWMFSTIYHEAGHAFFGLLVGMKPFDFSPYPHFREGHLYMGYVDFKNWEVADKLESVMHIGSEIFQVIGFFAVMLIYWRMRKASLFPIIKGQSKLPVIFLDGFMKTYGLFSLLDWPLYAINHSLKVSHFVFFGGPWWDGDVYLFAKNAGIYDYYWLINVAAIIWLIGAGVVLLFVQYPRTWIYLRQRFG